MQTPDFHRRMYADIGNDRMEIDTLDPKSNSLKKKYGEGIFGPTDESKAEYIEEVFPAFKKKVDVDLKFEMK